MRSGRVLLDPEWRQGWRTLTGCSTGIATGYGLYALVASVFVGPMAADFQWSRTAVTFAPMVGLIGALLYPFAGVIADRFGSRRTALAALAVMGMCYFGFFLLPQSKKAWLLLVGIFGVAAPFTGYVVLLAPVVRTFLRRRGTALALTMSGVSVAAALVLPLLQKVISAYGWRFGYLVLAALSLCIGLPSVALGVRENCEYRAPQAGLHHVGRETAEVDAPLRVLLRKAEFWLLAASLILAATPIGGMMAHSQLLLTGAGLSPNTAAWVGSLYALSMIVGRIVSGYLLDRLQPHRTAAVILTIAAAGASVLWRLPVISPLVPAAALAMILIGVAQGAEVDFVAFFAARHFGTHNYSRAFGVLICGVGLAMSAGGLGFARLYDWQRSYSLAYQLSAAAFLGAAALMLACRRFISPLTSRRSIPKSASSEVSENRN